MVALWIQLEDHATHICCWVYVEGMRERRVEDDSRFCLHQLEGQS